ncbi:MAG: J domain-containing protein [Kiloniellales bacterium]|nr:J domain-containing protein [Kiloniellales bacterium]
MKDPYKVLGVARDASADDIKRAYRKLAKRLHPDLNPGNRAVEQQFKEVSQAYNILGDEEKRKRFDRGEIDAGGQEKPFGQGGFYRRYAESGQGAKYRPFDFGEDYDVTDIFEDLFSGARGQQKQRSVRRKGADVSYDITVDFVEAVNGSKQKIRLADDKTLSVTIPEGSVEGQSLRLKGQGMAGLGGAPAGDAYIEIHVKPHKYFSREGNNIHLELPVTLKEAVAGAKVDAPTIHGTVTVTIPPGSNSGTVLRLRNKGALDQKTGKKGDQLLKLKVMLPDKIDKELADFVARWSAAESYQPRRKAGLG